MRLDVMKYFLEAVNLRSISKVSQKYDISQKTLSSMFLALEEELDTRLMIRSKAGVALTEQGRVFYQYCADFFKAYGELKQNLKGETRTDAQRTLMISTQGNIAQTLLPGWVSLMLKYYPALRPEIQIKSMAEVVADVVQGRAQLGFILRFEKDNTVYPSLPDSVTFHPLFSGKPYFWLHRDHPLAKQKMLSMRMLDGQAIMRDKNSDGDLFAFIMQYFAVDADFQEAANVQIMAQLVRNNLAVCTDLKAETGELALDYLFEPYRDEVTALPVGGRDAYKLVTGYVVDKMIEKDEILQKMLAYL